MSAPGQDLPRAAETDRRGPAPDPGPVVATGGAAAEPAPQLRLGLDVRPALYGRTGFARVARETLAALRRRPGLEVHGYGAAWRRPSEPVPDGVTTRRLPGRAQQLMRRFGFGVEDVLGELDVFHHIDLVFAPVRHATEVLTIHDLCFLQSSAWHGARFAARTAPRLRRRARAAAAVIVPSVRVADEVLARGFADPARVHVIGHGGDHIAGEARADDVERATRLAERAGLTWRPEDLVLLVPGTREPRKNQLALLEAFLALPEPSGRRQLMLLAGGSGWGCPELEARLTAPALVGRVGTVGAVDDDDLAVLLRTADVVAYPSLAEGFGLPVLEAMRCGRAVLTSVGTPMADLGGDAVLAVDPTEVATLRDGLAALLHDEWRRAELGLAAAERVAGLTWDGTARRLVHVYHAVCRRR